MFPRDEVGRPIAPGVLSCAALVVGQGCCAAADRSVGLRTKLRYALPRVPAPLAQEAQVRLQVQAGVAREEAFAGPLFAMHAGGIAVEHHLPSRRGESQAVLDVSNDCAEPALQAAHLAIGFAADHHETA